MLHVQGRRQSLLGKEPAVDESLVELEKVAPLPAMLGYLNLSTGKPDPRFQKQLNEAYAFLAGKGASEPHVALRRALDARLRALRDSGSSACSEARQAETVLALVFDRVLPAYRAPPCRPAVPPD